MFETGQARNTRALATTTSDKATLAGHYTQPVCQQDIYLASLTVGLWVIVDSDCLTRALRKQTGQWLGCASGYNLRPAKVQGSLWALWRFEAHRTLARPSYPLPRLERPASSSWGSRKRAQERTQNGSRQPTGPGAYVSIWRVGMGSSIWATEKEQLVRRSQGNPHHVVLWASLRKAAGSRQEWSHCDCSLSYSQKPIPKNAGSSVTAWLLQAYS